MESMLGQCGGQYRANVDVNIGPMLGRCKEQANKYSVDVLDDREHVLY